MYWCICGPFEYKQKSKFFPLIFQLNCAKNVIVLRKFTASSFWQDFNFMLCVGFHCHICWWLSLSVYQKMLLRRKWIMSMHNGPDQSAHCTSCGLLWSSAWFTATATINSRVKLEEPVSTQLLHCKLKMFSWLAIRFEIEFCNNMRILFDILFSIHNYR